MVVGSTDLGTFGIFKVAKPIRFDRRNSNCFMKRQDQDIEDTWEFVKNLRNIARHASKALFVHVIFNYFLPSKNSGYV